MKQLAVLLVFFVALMSLAAARSAAEWKSRVIYQILTDRFAKDTDDSSPCTDLKSYCGGTFNGIIQKLDYLEGLGINAIWISPIPEQTENGYHGYWQKNLYNINSHYGTSGDLHRLVQECHSRGIWVMVDIVGNHMGYQSEAEKFTLFYPFNQPEHYHSHCEVNNYHDQHEVENCRLAGLPDLDHSNSFVRSTLVKWPHQMVTMYEFDGMRVDTTHMAPKDFWKEYTDSAGVFTIGEVFNNDPQYVSGYQGTALDSLLDYTMYYRLKKVFVFKESMRNIHDGVEEKKIFPDPTILGAFLDNHDNHRFLSQNKDWTMLKNALAYIVFAESIPIIYYGTEQGFTGAVDPDNRESLWPHYDTGHWLYIFISTIVKFRGAAVYEAPQVERYVDDEFFAFSRGDVFVATTNVGSGGTLSRTITHHPYSDGITLENILDSSDTVMVEGGKFTVNIENGQPKIYYPTTSKQDETNRGECLEDGERTDCGFAGINQQECEAKGCCWSPKEGEPWCFRKSEVGFCRGDADCDQ